MTEYEQRVAEALDFAHGGRLVYGDSVADTQACDLCQRLAPRVAAAIAAGGRVVADGTIVAHANWEAALAALKAVAP